MTQSLDPYGPHPPGRAPYKGQKHHTLRIDAVDHQMCRPRCNHLLLADKAYDSDAIRELVRELGAWANIRAMQRLTRLARRRTPCCRSQSRGDPLRTICRVIGCPTMAVLETY
jgi:hypothetical protein